MKKLFRTLRLNLHFFCLLCSFFVSITDVYAQAVSDEKQKAEYENKAAEELTKYDLRDLKTTILLNKAIFAQQEVDLYRHPPRNSEKQIVIPTTAYEWQSLYERLGMAELRDKGKRIPDYEQFAEPDRKKLTKSNTIPIGILNLDATLLTEDQLKENQESKQQNKKLKAETVNQYERIHFINASVLQEDIFQADVNFRISPSLYISNNKVKVKQVELDFQDGKGYRSYPLSEKLIPYRFNAIGERFISIRLLTERGVFVFQSLINVKQLERIAPYREFEITGAEAREDTITPPEKRENGRMGINLPRGTARIIRGCDQVFDKPIIIGEGIDLSNNFGLDDMEAFYRLQLTNFLQNGYDLVLLDYNDSRDYLENNAEVMKSLINYVNAVKVGNNPSIVIGESMSGLIARYTLRKMENDGLNPQVSHFISYDSPHQGANIPVGITQVYWQSTPGIFAIIKLLFSRGLRDLYQSLESPAARQMIRRWGGRSNVGVGNSHPEYQGFRNKLQALGNNGYPQNSRNVAMINGSLDAGDRRLFDNFNYGSRVLFTYGLASPVQSVYLNAHTNEPNQNTRVLRFSARGLIFNTPLLGNDTYFQSPVNDDFVPGGRNPFGIPRWLRLFTPEFNFCFIPTYSAIDYSGPRDTQFQREFLNVNSVASSQTPFAAIYGLNVNTQHVDASNEMWNNLGTSENLYNNTSTACNDPNYLPYPTISLDGPSCLSLQGAQSGQQAQQLFTATTNANNGQYQHVWSVSAAGQPAAITTSNSYTFYLNEPGNYTITVTREDLNNPGVTRSTTVTYTVIDCDILSGNSGNINCSWLEGDYVTQLSDGQNVFAHFANYTLYASTENGGVFVSRSTLQANGVFGEFADCFATSDPRSGQAVPNGCYTIKAKNSNKLMQPENGNNGARIRQYSANGQSNQVFQLESVDSDAFKIKLYGTNKVWETSGASSSNGAAIGLWDYGGGNHQKWLLSEWGDGTYRLSPKHVSSKVADVEGFSTSDGAGLQIYDSYGNGNQRFYVSAVSCPSGGGGCTPPNAPTVTSSSASSPSNLTASGCSGTVDWSHGASGNSVTVSPAGTTTYTATCKVNGCTSGPSNSVTVTVSSGGCNFTEGQYLATFSATNEMVYAHYCGSTRYATTSQGSGGAFKPDTWLQNIGFGQYSCFANNDPRPNCGGGCTPPNAPTVTSSSASSPSNLTASGCSGTVDWSHGASGNSVTVSPASTTTYTATCKVNGCTSGPSNSVTVTVSSGGCNFTEGQYLATFSATNEMVYAHYCGSTRYATTSAGSGGAFKPDTWLQNIGFGQYACFANNDPRPNCGGGCTPPNAPTVTSSSASSPSNLTATGCSGTVDWSHGASGSSVTVSPAGTTTYTATCKVNGCTSGPSNSVTVTVSSGGGCNFTEGQYLATFSATNEMVYAHYCGSTRYATTSAGSGGVFKPDTWLQNIGFGQYSCFANNDPRPNCSGGSRIGTAEETAAEQLELIASPNPNTGEFDASFHLQKGSKATLSVSDMLGRRVWHKNLTGEGVHREKIRLSEQSVGPYILLLQKETTGNEPRRVEYKKVIVIK